MALSDTHVLAAARAIDQSKVGGGYSGATIVFLAAAQLFPWGSAARPDGGDLRVSADEAGASELPIDVIAFDGAAETGLVALRHPGIAAGADTPIYFWTGQSGDETAADPGAPYGRYAVWQDFAAVWTGFGLSDRSAGGHALTPLGNSVAGAADGPLGASLVLPGAATDGFTASGLALPGALTDLILYRNDRNSANAMIGVLDNGQAHETGQNIVFWTRSISSGRMEANVFYGLSNRAQSASRPAQGAWSFVAGQRDGTDAPVIYDRSAANKVRGNPSGNNGTYTDARIGHWLTSGDNNAMLGRVAFRGIYAGAASDGLVDTFAAALSSPSTFTKPIAALDPAIAGAALIDTDGVIQRGASGATIPLAGTYADFEPGVIEARYLPGGAWVEVDGAPAGGEWSGVLEVPTGGPFSLEIRSSDGAATAQIANGALVGDIIVAIGQSNMAKWSYLGSTDSAEDEVVAAGRVYDRETAVWRPTSEAGERAFVNRYYLSSGVPVGLYNMSRGSAGILQANDSGSGFWWDHVAGAGNVSALLSAALARMTNGISAVLMLGGERDAAAGTFIDKIAAGLRAMMDYIRGQTGLASLPLIIGQIYDSDYSGIDPADEEAVRQAIRDYQSADPRGYDPGDLQTIPLGADGLHATPEGNRDSARLFADTAAGLAGGVVPVGGAAAGVAMAFGAALSVSASGASAAGAAATDVEGGVVVSAFGAAPGAAAANGAGVSVASSGGLAAGTATAAGGSRATMTVGRAGTAFGSSQVGGSGAALSVAGGAADGTATVIASHAAISSSGGSAFGSAAALGVTNDVQVVSVAGTASGRGSANGEVRALSTAAGQAAGIGAAHGQSPLAPLFDADLAPQFIITEDPWDRR